MWGVGRLVCCCRPWWKAPLWAGHKTGEQAHRRAFVMSQIERQATGASISSNARYFHGRHRCPSTEATPAELRTGPSSDANVRCTHEQERSAAPRHARAAHVADRLGCGAARPACVESLGGGAQGVPPQGKGPAPRQQRWRFGRAVHPAAAGVGGPRAPRPRQRRLHHRPVHGGSRLHPVLVARPGVDGAARGVHAVGHHACRPAAQGRGPGV